MYRPRLPSPVHGSHVSPDTRRRALDAARLSDTVLRMRRLRVLLLLVAGLLLCLGGVLAVSSRDTGQVSNPDHVKVFVEAAGRCLEDRIPHLCMNELVLTAAPVLGVPSVIDGISEASETYPEAFLEQCHRAAHYLGEYAGETIPDVDDALELGTPFCQFGYYHGVMEGYARVTPTLFEELPRLCSRIDPDVNSTAYAECSHAMGHAIVTRTDNDVDEGIKYCRRLVTRDERKACVTGIFMSWSNKLDDAINLRDRDGTPIPEKFLIAPIDRRWEQCVELDVETAEACVHFLAETAPSQPVVGEVAVRQMRDFTDWCEGAFSSRRSVALACHGAVGRVSGADAVFAPIGGWPGVVDFCTSAGYPEAVEICLTYAYTAGAQFDRGIVENACRAWDGRPEQEEQCALIEELHGKAIEAVG